MQDDECQRDEGDLPVVAHDRIDAVRGVDAVDAGDAEELQAEHAQPDEAEGERDVDPEPAAGRMRATASVLSRS